MPTSTKGIRFVPANSRHGRSMAQAKGAHLADDSHIDPKVVEHNKLIEAERQRKLKLRKMQKWDLLVQYPNEERWVFGVPSDTAPTSYMGFPVMDAQFAVKD